MKELCLTHKNWPFKSSLSPDSEKGGHFASLDELIHFLIGRALLETAGGIQNFRQEPYIPNRIEEDIGTAQHPVNRPVNIFLLFKRLVLGIPILGSNPPGPTGDGLNRLNGSVTFLADAHHFVEFIPVPFIQVHQIVVRQEN